MTITHVIVDGSNIATEGRDAPSLAQLDEAVQAFIEEYAPDHVTVVVDATFPNRIDRKERKTYEDAVNANELITPPAGAIGRGDAFILQIARRADAAILSNDSFQEFHGEYPWLFERGRLIGGKPVPHVGWVFMERAPVRGPTSRRAVSEARKVAKAAKASKVAKATEAAAERVAADGTGAGDEAPPRPPAALAGQGAGGRRPPSRRPRRRPATATAPTWRSPRSTTSRPRARPGPGAGARRALQRGPAVHRVRGRPPGGQRGRRHDRAVQLPRRLRAGRLGDGPTCRCGTWPTRRPAAPRRSLRLGEQRRFVVVAVDPPRRGHRPRPPRRRPGARGRTRRQPPCWPRWTPTGSTRSVDTAGAGGRR